MITAHGAKVTVTSHAIEVTYSPLLSALRGLSTPAADMDTSVTYPISDITELLKQPPTEVVGGYVELSGPSTPLRVDFSPTQAPQYESFLTAIAAAQQGEQPASIPVISGFDFVAFDVETANWDWGSICQLGAVRFIDGQAVDERAWLVTPPPGLDSFSPENIAIHGISAEDVAGQPPFAEALAELADFVGELPMVAHNAQFDFTALSRAAAACDITPPIMHFACTLLLARSSSLGFANHRLPTLTAGFNIDFSQHHDALADARACGQVMVHLAQRAGFSGSLIDFFHSQHFTLGTLEPTRVYPVLRDRSGAGVALQRSQLGLTPPPSADLPSETVQSGENSTSVEKPAPKKRGSAPWSRVSTPEEIPEANAQAPADSPFYGQNVTLSGDFDPFDKGQLWEGIAALGGTIGKNVTKKTTIVVCGEWATKTSKQKRAEDLIAQGQEIAMWTQTELYTALGLDPESPMSDEQPPF